MRGPSPTTHSLVLIWRMYGTWARNWYDCELKLLCKKDGNCNNTTQMDNWCFIPTSYLSVVSNVSHHFSAWRSACWNERYQFEKHTIYTLYYYLLSVKVLEDCISLIIELLRVGCLYPYEGKSGTNYYTESGLFPSLSVHNLHITYATVRNGRTFD